MIGYLRGVIRSPKPGQVILDVNGAGYLVNISFATFEAISKHKEAELFIYTSVREDAIVLFGFSEETEKAMFELLITVNGIGPKLALNVLSGIRVAELQKAIARGDLQTIVSIPGIGKKTAERLVLELKGKMDIGASVPTLGIKERSVRSEAGTALVGLGYNQKTAEKMVSDILDTNPDISIEELLKQSLRKLSV